MKKVIVTTTINPPTEALVKFSKLDDWKLIVVGDLKTPHKDYQKLKKIIYLSPEQQEKMSKNISDIIGWNCIQRRNFGFMLSHKLKAEIIATVDDDNIPLKNWGKNILVGKKIKVKIYNDNSGFFDPLSVTEHKNLWHRGFPVQLLKERSPKYKGIKEVHCLVQADFWNGDPDIDAICRISLRPEIKFKKFYPFSSKNLTPFNSQNTFIHKSLLKHYLMFPGIGRMDDIWAAYYIQQKFKRLLPFIVFSSSSVYQNRNVHNYVLDLKKEIIGYEKTIFFKNQKVKSFLPKSCLKLINLYRDFFI